VYTWRGTLRENKKAWVLAGIVLLVLGASISLIGYFLDATYCKSLDKMLEAFFTNEVAFLCPSATYILLVIAGAIVSIVGIIFLIISLKPRSVVLTQKHLKSVRTLVVGSVGTAIVVMIITVFFDYVPINDITTAAENANFTVYIQRPSTILIPVKGIFYETRQPLQISVFHDNPPISKVNLIRLSTSTDSILSYFNSQAKNNTYVVYPTNSTSKTKIIYNLDVIAKHGGQVSNTSSPYNIDIFYTDRNGTLGTYATTFNWPIKTLDFNILVYFFIVFIGVVVSRYTTNLIDSRNNTGQTDQDSGQPKDPGQLARNDWIWIIVSGVITLLIFSSFQQQVELTSLLLTNISLAFTFGFGFDKILETGSKISDLGRA
jgi:hypothetical protein